MKLSKRLKLSGDIIGLDLGSSRTGVARLNTVARIAEPLQHINMNTSVLEDEIAVIVAEHNAVALVVGLPRNLEGQETDQTKWARSIAEKLEESLAIPVFYTDEAGTTKQAEERAKENESIDSVAAGIIVEDFANQVVHRKVDNVSF